MQKPVPKDEKLYAKVKSMVYKKYPKHSAYRSGHLVKQYKQKYKEKYGTNDAYSGKKPRTKGLSRWFKEDWKSDDGRYGYKYKSSVYRPTKRITKNTPVTFGELSNKEIKRAKSEKYRTGRVKRFKL